MSSLHQEQEQRTITPEHFPDEGKHDVVWMCWKDEGTKVPKIPGTRHNARTNLPGDLRSYEEAVKAYEANPDYYDGIAVVFQDDDPYFGIDLDGCRDPETGIIDEWAREIIENHATYSEVSPSRTGIKMWGIGRLPFRQNTKKFVKGERPGIEAYDGGKWFAVTGWHLEGTPRIFKRRQSEVTKLIREHWPEKFAALKTSTNGNGNGSTFKGNGEPFNLEKWLEDFNVPVAGEAPDNQGRKWRLPECPRTDRHSTDDPSGAYVLQYYGEGGIFCGCMHASCGSGRENLWVYLRDIYEPDREKSSFRIKTPGGGSKNGAANSANDFPTDPVPEWPEMDPAAYRGLFGRIVEAVDPHTEGDPVAVLGSAIVAFGNDMGRGPYVQIGATKHRVNLFCGIVGDTAKGRKGSTWDPVENIQHAADKRWTEDKIISGLSSGEGLINEVRDPIQARNKDGEMKVTDMGVKDKRILVQEGELSQALKVMKREGNTLSPVLRNAWDGKNLRTMVKHSPLKATEPHVSILGHITTGELIKHLNETEMANGLANRFLWLLVKRSKSLPFGGEWHSVNVLPLARKISGALEFGNRDLRMTWGEDARELWCEAYEVLTQDRGGMFGAVTARAEAQTLRLAMIYALADYSQEIRRTHIESALAVWRYAEASALYIFGDATGDPDADKVLAALKDSEAGLTRTEISELFGRNKSRQELDRIKEMLQRKGRIHVTYIKEDGSKKPIERWYAA